LQYVETYFKMYTSDNVSMRTARLNKLTSRTNTRRFFGLGWLAPFVLEGNPSHKRNAVGTAALSCKEKTQKFFIPLRYIKNYWFSVLAKANVQLKAADERANSIQKLT